MAMRAATNKAIAYTYIRWSDARQGGDRDSRVRQVSAVTDFCARHGLEYSPDRVIEDDGASGYAGAHIAGGALGDFLKLVQAKKIPAGVTLVVEDFDRISRLPPIVARKVIETLTQRDIRIGVVNGDLMLDAESGNKLGPAMNMLVRVHLANEESEKKRQRSRSAWVAKRKVIEAGGKLRGYHPKWLDLSADGKEWSLNRHADTVRLIFDLAESGHGTHRIAAILNERQIETLGRNDRWLGGSVYQILVAPSVHGEFRSRTWERVLTNEDVRTAEGDTVTEYKSTKKREAVGDVIIDYYRPVISRERVDRVLAIVKGRVRAGGGPGPMANVLQGLARCDECDGPLQLVTRRVRNRYLFCNNARVNKCSSRANIKFGDVVPAILHRAGDAFDLIRSNEPAERLAIADEIAALTSKRDRLQANIDALMGGDVTGMIEEMRGFITQAREMTVAITDLQRRATQFDAARTARPARYGALIDAVIGEPGEERNEAVRMINAALRAVIAPFSITMSGPDAGSWELETVGGWATTSSKWAGWHTDHDARSRLDAGQPSGIIAFEHVKPIHEGDDGRRPSPEAVQQAEHEIMTRPAKGRDIAARIEGRQRRRRT